MTRKEFFDEYSIKHSYTEAVSALLKRDELFEYSAKDIQILLKNTGYISKQILTPVSDECLLVCKIDDMKELIDDPFKPFLISLKI